MSDFLHLADLLEQGRADAAAGREPRFTVLESCRSEEARAYRLGWLVGTEELRESAGEAA